MDPAAFRDIVSGRRQGLGTTLLRGILRTVEAPYSWIVRCRNWAYDTGCKKIQRVEVPVVSVGNLTLGGTGKTPTVAWIAQWFAQREIPVAIVSRGYGAGDNAVNDEALELFQRLPDVPHVQDPNRVRGARRAIREFGCRVIILDDGFQHRRLHRDLDLVLIDALEPFGFEHVFPRGTLREPLNGLARAAVVALSRANLLDPPERMAIQQRIASLAPTAEWLQIAHRPTHLITDHGNRQPLEMLDGHRVAAFCGIGNPTAFRKTLEQCNCDIAGWREYPDHFGFTQDDDIQDLANWIQEIGVQAAVCTHKDLVKLPTDRFGKTPLWAVAIETQILDGQRNLEAALQRLIEPASGC